MENTAIAKLAGQAGTKPGMTMILGHGLCDSSDLNNGGGMACLSGHLSEDRNHGL